MTKFKQTYQEMVDKNQTLFTEFMTVHEGFLSDRKKWSSQFHEQGARVVAIIREYEQKLCASMERGNFAAFSNKVSEKFWNEVKKDYSRIEMVGVKSSLD